MQTQIFTWQSAQQQAFDELKQLCTHCPVLKFYGAAKPVEIHCEASSIGPGAVLLQDNDSVAFSSRSLTDAETPRVQTEKEMLSIVYAYIKFHHHILGKRHCIMTTSCFRISTRNRCCVLLCASREWVCIFSDMTSLWSTGEEKTGAARQLFQSAAARQHTRDRWSRVCVHGQRCISDWPEVHWTARTHKRRVKPSPTDNSSRLTDNWWELPFPVQPYWDSRSQLAVSDGTVYKELHTVLPPSMRGHMSELPHQSHQGKVTCKQWACKEPRNQNRGQKLL